MKNFLIEWKQFLIESNIVPIKQNPEQITSINQLEGLLRKEIQSGQLSPLSIVLVLYKVGFRGQDLKEATHIILGESAGLIRAERVNKDESHDHGLWQINDRNIIGTKFYNNVRKEIIARYDKTINDYKSKKQTPEIKAKINNVIANKQAALENIKAGNGVPFISTDGTFDIYASSAYTKEKMEIQRKKFGEDGKWRGWVKRKSKLDVKYTAEKRAIAEKTVNQFLSLLNPVKVQRDYK